MTRIQPVSGAKAQCGLWSDHTVHNYLRGSVYELDTKRKYDIAQTNIKALTLADHGKMYDSGYEQSASSSLARLFGHDLPTTEPTKSYLLQENYGSLPTGEFENNIDYNTGTISPILYYTTADFNGANSVYHEDVTNLLSDDSFLIGGWFRSKSLHTNETLFMYGRKHSDFLSVDFTNDQYLKVTMKQGSYEHTASIPSGKIRDLQWHYIAVFFDRTQDTAYLIVTNQQYEIAFVEQIDISNFTFGFGSSSTNKLVVGASYESGSFSDYFHGEASNFQVYKWNDKIDYNVLEHMLKGCREKASQGISVTTAMSPTKRFGSYFELDGDTNDFTSGLVNVDEGKYLLELTTHNDSEGGKLGIYIDNIYRGGIDTYAATAFDNASIFLDDLDLTKGYHFIKLVLEAPNTSSTDNKIKMSQIRLLKQSGPSEGGSSEFQLFGDEFLNRESNLTLGTELYRPWQNFFGHGTTGTVDNGNEASAEIFAAKGLYKLDYYFSRRDDGGNVEIYINDTIAGTIDTFTTPGVKHDTKYVRLAQGKNKITLKVNGKNSGSSGYRFSMSALTLYQQDETSHGVTTSIRHFEDVKIASGNGGVVYSTSLDHSQMIYNSGFGNKWRAKRWFAGGLYKLHLSYNERIDGAANCQLLIDGNETNFSCLSGATNNNQDIEKLITIPPGYHWVDVQILSGSSSSYVNYIDFKLLSRGTFVKKPTVEKAMDGLVKLGEYLAVKAEGVGEIPMGGIDFAHYSDFEFIAYGRVQSASTSIAAIINDIESSYGSTGIVKRSGVAIADVGNDGSQIELVSDELTGQYSRGIYIKGTLSFHKHNDNKRLSGTSHATSSIVGYQSVGFEGGSSSINFDGLKKFTILTPTGTWTNTWVIAVYGRKIQ